jgi:response regulator RpfG family c-di-GMP phosphodiesterase
VRGRGATFRIYFPKLAEVHNSTGSHPKPTPETIATILLVEDESSLHKLMKTALEMNHYRVFEAKDGAEGLSVCRSNLAHIDLVVTDLAMPQMTGIQLKEKVVELRPNMKFLLVSGYPEEVIRDSEHIANVGDFLEKPFPPDELVRKVGEILSRINGVQENTSPGLLSRGANSGTTHG